MNDPLRRSAASATLALVLCCSPAFAGPLTRKHKPVPAPPPPATPHASAQLEDKKLNARIDALLGQMTITEKIGQLTQYTGGSTITGPTGEKLDFDAMLAKGEIGSLFNVSGAKETNHYQHIAMERSRLHIPLLFGLDVIHGHRTTFPVPLALAASFDPEIVQQACRVAATEARQDGINWVFSPMVDISRDARWGRIVESAGEDPYLGSALARAYIRGYQQGDLSKPDSVAASVKHFAAYGAAEAGRDYNTTDMSEIRLRQVYLPPYQAAVDEGAATVMSAFNALNGVPASANAFTLTKILRKEWGFDGLVVSDYGAVAELMKHGIAGDGATAAQKALTAGVDMDMESNLYHSRLPALVESGQVPTSVVDEAVRRVLRVKFAMGLFEHPYTDENLPPYEPTPNCDNVAPPLYTGTDVGFSSLCVNKAITYKFEQDVLTELAKITPGPYLHIGGDEAQSTSLADYTTFETKELPIVSADGKRAIGWHDVTKVNPPTSFIPQFWGTTTTDAPTAAAAARGNKVIMSPANKAYLDMKYTPATMLGQNWAAYIEVKDAYSWDPGNYLTGVTGSSVLGVEGPIWSETLLNMANIEYLAFPRLPALAELGWSPESTHDWSSFQVRLGAQGPRWTVEGVNFYASPQIPWAPGTKGGVD